MIVPEFCAVILQSLMLTIDNGNGVSILAFQEKASISAISVSTNNPKYMEYRGNVSVLAFSDSFHYSTEVRKSSKFFFLVRMHSQHGPGRIPYHSTESIPTVHLPRWISTLQGLPGYGTAPSPCLW